MLMRVLVLLAVGVASASAGRWSPRALTKDSEPSFRSEARDRLAEEWGDAYAECVKEAQTPAEGGFFDEDDDTPELATDVERLFCRRKANALLP